jgi:FkbM family methyltransferase
MLRDKAPLYYSLYGKINQLLMLGSKLKLLGRHPSVALCNYLNKQFFRYIAVNGSTVVQTRAGFKIKVRLSDQAAASFLFLNDYSREETTFITKIINKYETFVDIGASYGYFSLLTSYLGCHRVLAFEPNHLLEQLIQESCNLNEFYNISLYPVALSNNCEKRILNFPLYETSSGGFLPSKSIIDIHSFEVSCSCLDNYIDQIKGPAFIKIDVEGHELEVFKGAIKVLTSLRPSIFWEIGHVDPAPAMTFLKLHQYNHFLWDDYKLVPLSHPPKKWSSQMLLSEPVLV